MTTAGTADVAVEEVACLVHFHVVAWASTVLDAVRRECETSCAAAETRPRPACSLAVPTAIISCAR